MADNEISKRADPFRPKRIGFVAAAPESINTFLAPHIKALKPEFDIVLFCNGRATDLADLVSEKVTFHAVPLEREISFLQDFRALFRLWRLFKKARLDTVHSITPKAGFLTMLAARLAGVPIRLHTFTGQVWATKKGFSRTLLKFADRLIVSNATQILADSNSQKTFLVQQGIVKEDTIQVLAEGSIAGVNLDRFRFNNSAREHVRKELGIADDALVFIFLGRLKRDKGVKDLVQAFLFMAKNFKGCHLLLVGPDEEGRERELLALSEPVKDRVHRMDFTHHPEHVLSAADVICLPSYREGFGSVLIEAAAVGLPAIASKIYGITDAGEEGVTYLLHKPGSVSELTDAMQLLADNTELRHNMGIAARKRASARFSEQQVTGAMVHLYRGLTA